MDKIIGWISSHKWWIVGGAGIIGLMLVLRSRHGSTSDNSSGQVANVGGYGGVVLGTPIGTGNTIPSADTGATQYPGGTNTGDNSGSATPVPAPADSSSPSVTPTPAPAPTAQPTITHAVYDTPPSVVMGNDGSMSYVSDSGQIKKLDKKTSANAKKLFKSGLPSYKIDQIFRSGRTRN